MEEIREVAIRDESLPIEVPKEKVPLPVSTVQSRMEELIPFAGTIEITEEQKKILFAPVDPESVEIRPDGLVYLPWMAYVGRLRNAFGIAWAVIPKDMPKLQGNHMYWPFYLMIQGKLAGFAIGEQEYQPNNAQMTYSDASEGAKSNALMRLCKGIGISLELWKPSFIRGWKAKYAESFPAVWPDGKPKLDKNGKQKVEWKRKDRKIEEAEEVVGDEPDGLPQAPPPASSPKPEKPKTKNFDFLKSMSDAKKALGEEKYYEILTGQYNYMHANLVVDEKGQKEIYEEMKKAYKEKAKGKGK